MYYTVLYRRKSHQNDSWRRGDFKYLLSPMTKDEALAKKQEYEMAGFKAMLAPVNLRNKIMWPVAERVDTIS